MISYYVALHNSLEFSEIKESNMLFGLLVALFAGVSAYGIHRSLLYPWIEYWFDSDRGKDWRKRMPFISSSTIGTLQWRWDSGADVTRLDPEQINRINEHLNVWGDLIHLQYTSAICIGLGAIVGEIIVPSRLSPYWPLIALAGLFILAAFVSNWRHHSVLDRFRNPTRHIPK
ncbi:MAG: hypothetical protein NT159_22905 [Proteobacteria bacterium]|nr:hypothetical protein [Pseudomonadota bacterium]